MGQWFISSNITTLRNNVTSSTEDCYFRPKVYESAAQVPTCLEFLICLTNPTFQTGFVDIRPTRTFLKVCYAWRLACSICTVNFPHSLFPLQVLLYVDVHGHSKKANIFMYGVENSKHQALYMSERVIPVLLDQASPLFSLHDCRFDVSPSIEARLLFELCNPCVRCYNKLKSPLSLWNSVVYPQLTKSPCLIYTIAAFA